MKRRLLLTLVGMVVSLMVVGQTNRTNPDDARYFIKGNLSIELGDNGKTVYKLSQIDNQGIYFDNPEMTRLGEETSLEDVLFQFSRASTDYPGGINTPLDFWRFDNTINEWQPDGETRQGTAGVEEKKSMVVMLVLDCSSSLGTDFNLLQGAANNFIRSIYEASKGAGNIKLGIVSFSKINETQVFNIRPLTSESYIEMTLFINRLSTQNGTALYYAMDKSVELMDEYCKELISSAEPLSAAIMVTFTDGLDQTSRDPGKNILTADNYYDEVLAKYGNKMQNKIISGIPLQHEIRGVKGNDIISEAQLGKFQRIGESLGNFKLLNNYSELGAEFTAIAQNLINQWRILKLYVPNSFSGRVAWTYPGERVKPAKKWFFGINMGVGVSYYAADYSYIGGIYHIFDKVGCPITFGLDAAFPVSKKLNLGLFFSAGFDVPDFLVPIEVGPLFLVNFDKGSLYLGTGFHTDLLNFGADIRIGYEFNCGLYLFYEATLGEGVSFAHDSIFHLGYNFLSRVGKKRK